MGQRGDRYVLNRILAILVLLISLDASKPGRAAEDPIYAPLQRGATIMTMEEIGLSIQRTQCRRPACQAIRDFARLEEPLGHKTFINSATMADPSKFDPRVFDRQINHLLTLHKERHKALCDMMATVLSHDVDHYDRVEGRYYLEIASRLASLDQPGCLAQATAALPPTRFGDDLLAYMRGECLDSPWDGPDRHQSCDRFTRPAPPAARQ